MLALVFTVAFAQHMTLTAADAPPPLLEAAPAADAADPAPPDATTPPSTAPGASAPAVTPPPLTPEVAAPGVKALPKADAVKNNRLLAAGIAAGATCLGGPCVYCCAGLAAPVGLLCVPFEIGALGVLATGGAAGGSLAAGADLSPATIGAAAGAGLVGGVVAGAVGLGLFTFAAATSPRSTVGGSLPPLPVISPVYTYVWGALAIVLTAATAAAVGAAVYVLMPEENAPKLDPTKPAAPAKGVQPATTHSAGHVVTAVSY